MKNTLFFLSLLLTSMSYAQTVQIGTQVWMTKNLDVATFRNGDPIPEAKTNEEWKKAADNKQPAWCYYDNNPAYGAWYGKLYNWYAVNDPRGLAPEGYHIPSDTEWKILEDFLGGYEQAGIKMKSTSFWNNFNKGGNGTNSSGFSGLPGGYRSYVGSFTTIGTYGVWWSSSEYTSFNALYHMLNDTNGYVGRNNNNKSNGSSVRCIKD